MLIGFILVFALCLYIIHAQSELYHWPKGHKTVVQALFCLALLFTLMALKSVT